MKASTKEKNSTNTRLIFGILSIISVIMLLGSIAIFRKTIIGLELLPIIFVPGIISTLLLRKRLNKVLQIKAGNITHYLSHTLIIGSFLLFSFLSTNYYFSKEKMIEKDCKITQITTTPGSHGQWDNPNRYLTVDYLGKELKISINSEEFEKIAQSDSYPICTRQGLFGFEIIVSDCQ